jgi:hypothetical protein
MTHFRNTLFAFLILSTIHASMTSVTASAQYSQKQSELEVIGTGRIHHDDVAKARDEAITHGLWDAIEKGVEQFISASSVVSNFQLLSSRIYSRPEEFIHEYKVLTESKSGRYYRVVVRATLMMQSLEESLKDIGVLVTDKAMPSLLLILAEKNIDALAYNRSWGQDPFARLPLTSEEALDNLLSEKGFSIIRPETPTRINIERPYEDDVLPTETWALAMAQQVGAEVVIIGKADVRLSGNVLGTDMKSIEATISLKALKVVDGTVLGVFESTKVAVNINQSVAGEEALSGAAATVAEDLNRKISATWGREMSKTVLVELMVQGIEAYGDFVRFRKVLRNEVGGIKNVYLKAIKSGEAKMDIELQGNTQVLAEELLRKRFDGFGINIFEIGEKQLRLELIPKTDTPLQPNSNGP